MKDRTWTVFPNPISSARIYDQIEGLFVLHSVLVGIMSLTIELRISDEDAMDVEVGQANLLEEMFLKSCLEHYGFDCL